MAGADTGADPGAGPGRQWHVALSFAGAQRDYVGRVAQALKARGVRCFYDADEEIDLWGKSLAEELPVIYGEQAAVVVVFVSADYAARDWTRLERRAALARAVRERREYVLPARFDDTLLPGLLPDVSYVDLRTKTPQQLAAMIEAKMSALGIAPSASPDEEEDFAHEAGLVPPPGAVRVSRADPRRLGAYAPAPSARWLAITVTAVASVIAVVVYLVAHPDIRAGGAVRGAGVVADQFIYTTRTANDATIALPDVVKEKLLQIGLAHQTIALTRVGYRATYPCRTST